MNKTIILIISLFCGISSFGQLTPVYNVPSPEVANLGMYGNVPVSLFTGTPDINIPLYEMKVGKYSLPITARYHTASVKPHAQPGPLGLGWSLMAGGYITRSVRFIYDEKMNTSGHEYGFYGHAAELKNMTETGFQIYTNTYMNVNSVLNNSYYELSPDEFSFNFCGYTGNFYYNDDCGWTVVSDDDIKVEFDPNTGFMTWAQVNQRFQEQNWSNSSKNNRFFSKFTLVTPDGARYEFGGLNATEFSINYYGRQTSDLIATTWRLTKIITPDKHEINFTYTATQLICDLRYVPTRITTQGYYYIPTNVNDILQKGWSGFTGFLVFPVELVQIDSDNETIDFTYNENGLYRSHFNNTKAVFLDNNTDYYRYNSLYWNYCSEASELNLFVNAQFSLNESPEIIRNKIIEKFRCLSLHRICAHKKISDTYRNIYFQHNPYNRMKISKIIFRDGYYPLQAGNGANYVTPENTSLRDMPEYSFDYDGTQMASRYAFSKTDSWGYFRDGEVSISETPTFGNIPPDLVNSEAQVLKAIHYPTGGWSEFEYENHDYSKIVSDDRQSLNTSASHAGGLRVMCVKDFSKDSSLVQQRRFHYSVERHTYSAPNTSSGILRDYPSSMITFHIDGSNSLVLKNQGGFFPNVTNQNSPDVGYSCVIEETLDANGNSQGYVRNYFSNYGQDIYGETHYDDSAMYSVNVNPASDILPITPYTSKSMERGKLLKREFFDTEGEFVREEEYHYEKTDHDSILSPMQHFVFYGYIWTGNTLFPMSTFPGWMSKTYTYSYFPVKVSIREWGKNGCNTYERALHYGQHKTLQSDSILNSDSTKTINTYTYPFDYNTSPYLQMCDSHYLLPTVTSTTVNGSHTKTTQNIYDLTSTNIPYIRKQNTVYGGNAVRENYEVLAVDPYGNPTEIIENGIHSVLLWAQYGQLLIAHIRNMSLPQLMGAAASIDPIDMSKNAAYSVNYTVLRNLRESFPESLFDIYKYKNDMNLESHENPNGFMTKYMYDDSGRLHKKGYADSFDNQRNGKILNVYDYRYYNNNRYVNMVFPW